MLIQELDQKLDKALSDFSDEMMLNYKNGDHTPATKSDLDECARQTYYLCNEFRKSIVQYLQSR